MGLAVYMPRLQEEVWALVRREGVVARREHPALRGAIDWLVRDGQLRGVLPGVYAPADCGDDFRLRVAAVSRWAPAAVLTGAAAARLTFWPSLTVDLVEVATSRRGCYPGFRLTDRSIPAELVLHRNGLRVAAPALAAIDLAETTTDALDQVLRPGPRRSTASGGPSS